jgi:uncharacterized protein (TIGR00251 family)
MARWLVAKKTMFTIDEIKGGISFRVRVHPRARRDAIAGEIGDALKIDLKAPPVDGRANEACIEFFAKLLKVPRGSVTIASGHSGRNKIVRISGITAEQLRRRLAETEANL